jgi:hypothetical protein
MTSFSFAEVSTNGLQSYMMKTVPSASPMAAMFWLTEMEVRGQSLIF